ncbi:MAG: tyrosine-type recombinase/integrase [Muribaculaceae bacterium]|nr:tyrosine-type recombinase/integrase [Muribaculaceae bacterium]
MKEKETDIPMCAPDATPADRQQLLGRYIMELPPAKMAVCSRRVQAVTGYLDSGLPLDTGGYLDYLKAGGARLTAADRKALLEFARWCGIRPPKEGAPSAAARDLREGALTPQARQLIDGFLHWCVTQRHYSDNTMRMKAVHMEAYYRHLPEFTPEGAALFLDHVACSGAHPRTQNLYMNTLRQYAQYAAVQVCFRRVKVPRGLSVENVPTPQEYDTLLRRLRDSELWTSYWIVRVLGCTGMRLSELRQVTWRHILDGEAFPLCKGGKYRIVYFPSRLTAEARLWLEGNRRHPEEPVVTSQRTGRPLTDRGISRMLRADAARCAFPADKAHCHAFRHFFAKRYLERTQDIAQLAELLGHASVDTTRLYLQKSRSEQHRAIDSLVDW